MMVVPTPLLVGALWLIWGATFLFIKIGVGHTTPYVFAALRVAVSVAVIVTVVGVRSWASPSADRTTSGRRLHTYGFGLAVLNVAAYLPVQTAGIALSDVGISAILIYTQPLLVAVFARRLLHEYLTGRQLVGLFVGWVGVATAALAGVDTGATQPLGIVLLLTAAATWAGGSVLFKRVPRVFDLWRLLLWQNAYALPILILVALVAGGTTDWGLDLAAMALLAGAGGGVGGFALLFVLLRRGEASIVSSWIFAVPIIASVLGVFLRGERLTTLLVAGGVMVGTGIYLVTRADVTRSRHPPLLGDRVPPEGADAELGAP